MWIGGRCIVPATLADIVLMAVAAVALCVALVITVVSVMTGFLDMVKESGRTLMGDVVVGYPVASIPYYEELIEVIEGKEKAAVATAAIVSSELNESISRIIATARTVQECVPAASSFRPVDAFATPSTGSGPRRDRLASVPGGWRWVCSAVAIPFSGCRL